MQIKAKETIIMQQIDFSKLKKDLSLQVDGVLWVPDGTTEKKNPHLSTSYRTCLIRNPRGKQKTQMKWKTGQDNRVTMGEKQNQ